MLTHRRRKLQRRETSEYNLALFFVKYGPSTRDAYKFAGHKGENTFSEGFRRACAYLTLEKLRTFVSEGLSLDFKHGMSDQVVLLIPGSLRYQPNVRFTSNHVCRMLVMALRKKDANAASQLYRNFNSTPYTKPCAGNIFDEATHATFVEGGYLPIFPLKISPKRGAVNWHWKTDQHPQQLFLHISPAGFSINDQRPASSMARSFRPLVSHSFIPNETTDLQTGYYRPAFQNQAMFDAFIYDAAAKHALLIHATVLEKHSVKVRGIEHLEELGVVTFSYLIATPPDTLVDLPFPITIQQKITSVYQFMFNIV